MRGKLVVGNWKMHGTRAMLAEARAIDRAAERLLKVEVALAPPYTLIHATRNEAGLTAAGAQDHALASVEISSSVASVGVRGQRQLLIDALDRHREHPSMVDAADLGSIAPCWPGWTSR